MKLNDAFCKQSLVKLTTSFLGLSLVIFFLINPVNLVLTIVVTPIDVVVVVAIYVVVVVVVVQTVPIFTYLLNLLKLLLSIALKT
jgi:hypothetical protein